MGLDLMDIVIQIEDELCVEFQQPDLRLEAGKRSPKDTSVAEFAGMFLHLKRCRKCRYDLGGHNEEGTCPECGTRFWRADKADVIEAVRRTLIAQLGLKPERVKPESLLIRDLGLT